MAADESKAKQAPSCPKCGGRLRLRPDQLGEQVRCPKCNATFTVGRPAEAAPPPSTSPDDPYEPEIPLVKSTIVAEEAAIKFDPPPVFAEATVVAQDDYVPETTIVPIGIPIATAIGPYTADWATDELEAEAPHAPPPSMEPDYLELARKRGLVRTADTRPVPKWTFFSGVFLFPWQLGNIARWATMTVGLTLTGVLLLVAVMAMAGGVNLNTLLMPLVSVVGAGLLLITLSFCAACFLAAVDDTADGHDDAQEVTFPPLDEWFFSFFSVLGIWLMSGALGYPLVLVPALGPAMIPLSSVVLFPVLLLSAMECGSYFLPLSGAVWKSILRFPGNWLAFYLVSTAVLAGWYAATATAIGFAPVLVVLVSPAALAAVILIYARLLGRLAWRITSELSPAEDRGRADVETSHYPGEARKPVKRKKGRQIKLQIPDESPERDPADPPPAPRPRLDFHKRP